MKTEMTRKERREYYKGRVIGGQCPKCGATNMIGNKAGQTWCGNLDCDYGLTDYTKPGMAISLSHE